MRTREFKKWLSKNFLYHVSANEISIINVFGVLLITISIDEKKMCIDSFVYEDEHIELLNKAIEYYNTPISERGNGKTYILKYNDSNIDISDTRLVQNSNGKFYFSTYLSQSFTQDEIDAFPAEIKGAVDCGFLRKVEADQTDE